MMSDFTIMRNGLNTEIAGDPHIGQSSEDVTVEVKDDGTYSGYAKRLYYSYCYHNELHRALSAVNSNNEFIIPVQAFFEPGMVKLSVELSNGTNSPVCNACFLVVTNGAKDVDASVLPSEKTWQSYIQSYIKSDVDALGKRIDNLILSSGSDSSSEVIDARTGYDGAAHDTLGTAIRTQVNDLKEDLYNKVNNDDIDYNVAKQLSNMVEKIKVDNSWNEDYGNYFDKGNGNLIEYEQMRMCSLSVNAGDIYDIKSRVMYRIALWSMHDSAGNAVKWWNDGNMSLPLDYVEDNGIVIPSGVTELRVYAYVGHLSGYVKKHCLKIKEDSPLKGMTWCPIGDSLTDKATLSGGKNYVDYVSESTGLTVVKNCGVGGTGYLADNKGTSKCFYNRVISTDEDAIPTGVDIYTIFGSFNDMGKFTDDTIGTIESTDISTLIGAMVRTISAILYKNPDAIVGVIFPTPWASYNNTTIAKRTTTEKYINALQEACEKYSIPYLDLYHQSGLRPWDSNFNKKYYIDDNADGNYIEGVHPNTEGHKKFITPKVLNFIESLVFMN